MIFKRINQRHWWNLIESHTSLEHNKSFVAISHSITNERGFFRSSAMKVRIVTSTIGICFQEMPSTAQDILNNQVH